MRCPLDSAGVSRAIQTSTMAPKLEQGALHLVKHLDEILIILRDSGSCTTSERPDL